MSGRLVILPKKSYCPWRPENVERVLRDERRDAERLERAKEIATRHESELRLTLLRKQQGLPTDVAARQPQHVNLFQAEEDASLQKMVKGSNEKKAVVGVMPVYLGQTALKIRGDCRPFYLHVSEQMKKVSVNEFKRRDAVDPMKKFSKRRREKNKPQRVIAPDEQHADHDRRRRKRQKKSNKERGRKLPKYSTCSCKGHDNLQELRRRRQEREAQESIRESALFQK